MKANWSLVLNIVLLIGVVYAITRLMLSRKKESRSQDITDSNNDNVSDDIISVRKLDTAETLEDMDFKLSPANKNSVKENSSETLQTEVDKTINETSNFKVDFSKMIMIFLSAKENQDFAGYELLQSLLSAGLRFGEGDIFHKYQKTNGQGAVLFSLAAATQKGTFDLQTIGSFKVRGLCMYMYLSGNNTIDFERFTLMYDTAKSLAEDLNAHLLDDRQKAFSAASMDRYRNYIHIAEEEYL